MRASLGRWLTMGAAFAAAIGLGSSVARGQASGCLRVDFVSVGQGDAALIVSPAGKTVLIDGGPKEGEAALLAKLSERHVGILDLILLTHRHADHLGGLAAVVRTHGARMFMDAPFLHPSPAYGALLETLSARQVAVRTATRGRQIDLGGGAVLTLLSPPEPPILGTRSDVNTNSVVARLDYGRIGFLFAADAERETEEWLLAENAPVRAHVLKVPHHGSRYASTGRFINRVAPDIAVISSGAGNEYGHPAPETLTKLEQVPAWVFRTDQDGTVTVETDGARLQVETASGRRERLENP
jgi:competence protein ComEC